MERQQQPFSDRAAGGLSVLEQNDAQPVCDAPRRPLLRALNHDRRVVIYFKPRCKSWKCPACAELNKRAWTARIYEATAFHLAQGASVAFTTLTTHEKLSVEQSWRLFYRQWERLKQRARRKAGGGEYVMIPEAHQSGKMHVHMLDTFALPTRWWKDNARACGLGFMAESEFAETPGGAARYAAKYLGKALNEEKLKGIRRVRKSKGFLKPQSGDGLENWTYVRLPDDVPLALDVEHFERQGYTVEILQHFEVYERLTERGANE